MPALFRLIQRVARPLLRLGCLVALAGLLTACKTVRLTDPVIGPSYEPQNVYRTFDQLSAKLRRIAVLPMTSDLPQSESEIGLETLAPVVSEELGKTGRFELVPITPAQLRSWIGRSSVRAEDALPVNFPAILKRELDCDGVLFTRLTQYRPYPPLAVGFSFKLAELDTADLIWAVDEVFDANEPSVVNGARRYQLSREQLPGALSDSRSILNSPRGFSRYAAAAIFQTLPTR